ncbi:MAG: DinB family protein [Flavipsychrobacter sp.]
MNYAKSLLLLLSLSLLFTQCKEQQEQKAPSYTIAQEQIEVWDVAIEQVLELADAMPDELMNFRPHDSMRSFAEQLIHIGQSSEIITNLFLKDIPRPDNVPVINAANMTKADIKSYIKEKLEIARATMASMSNKELLNEEVTSFAGNKMTRLEGMQFVHDHLTNHKAKANLYMRLAGQIPPKYKYY